MPVLAARVVVLKSPRRVSFSVRQMGCCFSSGEAYPAEPMRGGDRVGREGGAAVTRDDARERAAAAAEARANAQPRGQQGAKSKMKVSAAPPRNDGRPDISNPAVWD